MSTPRVPTIDDIRLKRCFICLEETVAKDPWVHPCPTCAPLAHESCLIRWTASLPVSPRPRTQNQTIFDLLTLRCPRCLRPYELAEPLTARVHTAVILLNTIYRTLGTLVDTVFTGTGLLMLEIVPLSLGLQSRVMVLSAMVAYELAFLRSYLGERLFRLMIPNTTSDLLRSLFITLPTLPFRLLLPGTVSKWVSPLYGALPALLYGIMRTETGARLTGSRFLTPTPTSTTASNSPSPPQLKPRLWPPTPLLIGLLVPSLIQPIYNSLRTRLESYLLGRPPPLLPRRYLTERVRSVFTLPGTARRRRGRAAAGAANDANNDQAVIALQDDDQDPLLLATRIIHKDQKSLTHDVVHAISALVLPRAIGAVLRRSWLGAAPRANGHAKEETSATVVLKTFAGLFLGGVGVWAEDEPVWWQTSVGWGIYVIAKDALALTRMYFQTAEVRSRAIKSRDFAGVDVRELDLVEGWEQDGA